MASSEPFPNENDLGRAAVLAVCSFFHRFRIVVLIVYALVVAAVGLNGIHRAVKEGRSTEFRDFRQIVQESVVRGNDHYQTISHLRAYPPFFAIAFAPFGLQPLLPGAVSFVAVCIVFAVASVWLCTRTCFGGDAPPGAGLILFLLPGTYMLAAIARCETDLLVLMPLAGAFALMSRRRGWMDLPAGALLGFAAAFKLTPALFGLFLLIQRRWTALLSMILSGAILVGGLGLMIWGFEGTVERHRSWYEKILKPYSEEGPTAFIAQPYRDANQSPTAALFRLLNEDHAGRIAGKESARINVANLSPRAIRKIASGIKLFVLAALVVGWWISAGSPSPLVFGAAFASVVLGMLILGDVSLLTHHVTLVFPCGVCLAALSKIGTDPIFLAEGKSAPILPRAGLLEASFPGALALMLVGALHIGRAISTLALADFVLLACMLAVLVSGVRPADSARSPGQRGDRSDQ